MSRRHRWISGVARLSMGDQVGATSEGAAVRGLWGGAVFKGRVWRSVDGFLTSLVSRTGGRFEFWRWGLFLLRSLRNCEVVSRCAGLFGERLAVF